MIFQLGKIKFEVLTSPSELTFEESKPFVQQPRLVGKPTLQLVGDDLQTVSFTLRFHYKFCNVRESLDQFRDAMRAAQELEFIDASGFSYGQFVIEKTSREIIKVDELGVPISANLSVSLLEYSSGEDEDPGSVRARKDGFASVRMSPIEVKVKPTYQSETSLVMRDVVASKTAAASASLNIKKAAQLPDMAKKYFDKGARDLQKAKAATAAARAGVGSVQGKISNAAALGNSLDTVASDLVNITDNYNINNLSELGVLARGMDENVSRLMSAASQLSTVVAIRK